MGGRSFGKMNRYHKRLEFGVSPFELAVFPRKGFFSFIPNTLRRLASSSWAFVPIAGTYYSIKYMQGLNEKYVLRKNPDDYKDDQ